MLEKIKDIFKLKTNNDAKRFEFTPQLAGFTSYSVLFDEVDSDEEKAWQAVAGSWSEN
jgi:hypothetical protein